MSAAELYFDYQIKDYLERNLTVLPARQIIICPIDKLPNEIPSNKVTYLVVNTAKSTDEMNGLHWLAIVFTGSVFEIQEEDF